MVSADALQQILDAVHAEPELYGSVIGLYADGQSRVLDPGFTPSLNYGRVMVILEDDSGGPVLKAAEPIPAEPVEVAPPAGFVSNRSRVGREAAGAGLTCTSAVVSGVGVFGGAAAEIPTGGLSTVLVVASWTGFVMSGIECINGVVRNVEAWRNPESDSLEQWDHNKIYDWSMWIVDALGVASAVVSVPFAVRDLLAVLRRQGGLMTTEQLGKLSRAERQVAVRDALERASRSEEGRKAMQQALRDAGLSEKQAGRTMAQGAGTIRRGRLILRAVSRETTRRLNSRIRDILGGALGVGGSAPSSMVGSASGSVHSFLVHVIERE